MTKSDIRVCAAWASEDDPNRTGGSGEDDPNRAAGSGEDDPNRAAGSGEDDPNRTGGSGEDDPNRTGGSGEHTRPVYTLSGTCPECGAEAVNSAPAPFDPADPYGEYRRRARSEGPEE